MTTRTIREQDLCATVRVAVPARVDRAPQPLRIDVNVGDPVTPAPTVISYPALLGESAGPSAAHGWCAGRM
jgi:hypothetical protein